jgi:hypothetical protein
LNTPRGGQRCRGSLCRQRHATGKNQNYLYTHTSPPVRCSVFETGKDTLPARWLSSEGTLDISLGSTSWRAN